MMLTGWIFPWPLLALPAGMVVVMIVFMVRLGPARTGGGPGCGAGPHLPGDPDVTSTGRPHDPVLTLRERYARGEIDTEEFERRVAALRRSVQERATTGQGR